MLFKGQSEYTSFALQTMHCKSKWRVATSWICYAPSNHRSTECTCSIYLTTRKITFVIIDLKKKKKVLISLYFYDWSMRPEDGWGWCGMLWCHGVMSLASCVTHGHKHVTPPWSLYPSLFTPSLCPPITQCPHPMSQTRETHCSYSDEEMM